MQDSGSGKRSAETPPPRVAHTPRRPPPARRGTQGAPQPTVRERCRQQDVLPLRALGVDRIENRCDVLLKAQVQEPAVRREGVPSDTEKERDAKGPQSRAGRGQRRGPLPGPSRFRASRRGSPVGFVQNQPLDPAEVNVLCGFYVIHEPPRS